jgi:hypothetical protein
LKKQPFKILLFSGFSLPIEGRSPVPKNHERVESGITEAELQPIALFEIPKRGSTARHTPLEIHSFEELHSSNTPGARTRLLMKLISPPSRRSFGYEGHWRIQSPLYAFWIEQQECVPT